MKEKQDIRLHVRNQFKSLDRCTLKRKTDKVLNHLYQWHIWKESQVIAITMSTKNEINTMPIIEKGWEEGKRVAVPKVNPELHTMEFYEITSFEQTKEAFAGIMEPIPANSSYIRQEAFDLIIVPGLAFDKDKFRIGFGGGFYDRMLAKSDVPTCGLALDFQFHETLPRQNHDISLMAVITESGIVI